MGIYADNQTVITMENLGRIILNSPKLARLILASSVAVFIFFSFPCFAVFFYVAFIGLDWVHITAYSQMILWTLLVYLILWIYDQMFPRVKS